jgi:hypothetical protein
MTMLRSTIYCLLACSFAGCNAGTSYPKLDPYANMGIPAGQKTTPAYLLERERQQAVRFDPYTDNDIGPEVDGGRPPGFGQQLPETVRSRWVR